MYTHKVTKIENGYLVNDSKFFETLEGVFDDLLMKLEGRSVWFGGDAYGCVKVFSKPGQQFTSPEHSPA